MSSIGVLVRSLAAVGFVFDFLADDFLDQIFDRDDADNMVFFEYGK